jgi:hypothetical protein
VSTVQTTLRGTIPPAMIVTRPPASEYGPSQSGYISRITGDVDPLVALAEQQTRVLRLFGALTDEGARARYEAGKWSIKQCIGHMSDAERVFAYRMLRFARSDQTALQGFDQDVFMAGSDFDSLGVAALVADWAAVRAATLTLVRTIAAGDWKRPGIASGRPSSARAMLYVLLGHTDHHEAVFRDRYGLVAP